MEYVLDLDRSYFRPEELDGKDLVFADPMNATGGSLVTVVKYILDLGVKPRSVKFLTIISALKGALRAVRAVDNMTVYTLWMDPALNEMAVITSYSIHYTKLYDGALGQREGQVAGEARLQEPERGQRRPGDQRAEQAEQGHE